MSEPTNQPAPDASSESGRIQETMLAELYDTAIVQERREQSIRFLLNLPPPAPIPADAEARIEQLLARWEDEQKQLQAVLEDQLRQLLGIEADIPITDDMIPSVEAVREELNKYIPYEESLSDLIIAMREE